MVPAPFIPRHTERQRWPRVLCCRHLMKRKNDTQKTANSQPDLTDGAVLAKDGVHLIGRDVVGQVAHVQDALVGQGRERAGGWWWVGGW